MALRLVAPFNANLRTLLYHPSAAARIERAGSLPELLGATVLGYVPHRLRSGFVLNSRGFRTREYDPARTGAGDGRGTDVYRIVTLGDSFNFASGGVPYDAMWSSHLERRLADAGRPVEVLALGVPGVGPRFELRLWQLERDTLAADLVLLAFFVGNDLSDEQTVGRRARLSEALARWSYAWRLGRNYLRLRAGLVPTPPLPSPEADPFYPRGDYSVGDGRSEVVAFTPAEHLRVEALRLELFRRDRTALFARLLKNTAPVLRRFAAEVRAAGAGFAVVLIPDELQVDDALYAELLAHLGLAPDAVDRERPQRELAALFVAEGVPVIDLLPVLRAAAAAGERVYWPRNTHWNERGNALAGEAVATRLLADPPWRVER